MYEITMAWHFTVYGQICMFQFSYNCFVSYCLFQGANNIDMVTLINNEVTEYKSTTWREWFKVYKNKSRAQNKKEKIKDNKIIQVKTGVFVQQCCLYSPYHYQL